MDGSPSTRGGRPVVLNDNDFEDEEDHELMVTGSEDEESPPQLVFTDGSCSDSNSHGSGENLSSPCGRSESCPSPLFHNSVHGNKGFVDESVSTDAPVRLGHSQEDVFQRISGGDQTNLQSYSCIGAESPISRELEACFDIQGLRKSLAETKSPEEKKNDGGIALVHCTTYSPNEGRDEVDMDVSSGDESNDCTSVAFGHGPTIISPITQKYQPSPQEKNRIEENIQALMKEFERKRFEEKVRRAAEVVSNIMKQRAASNAVSTTSELSPVVDEKILPCSEQNSTAVLDDEQSARGPLSSINSPPPYCANEDCHRQSTVDKSQIREGERDDIGCELPSSSVEVPPVPLYEEIEQCIYKVESRKKAVSLMCFCRGNNLDCSDSRCDNRAMFTECPKNCLGKGNDCKNRRFAKREYAAVQAFYTGPNKGFGVQAVAPIKKGQFIIEYVGEVVSSEEFSKRLKRYGRDPSHTHHYMFEIGSMIIDATKKGNCSRFMNHSCEPNAVCEKWYVPRTPCAIDRIGFFAKRDIELGEEITFDYQFENYGREAQRCFCGTSACSGWIGKPPELLDEDFIEVESESEDTEGSEDEGRKSAEQILPRFKKSHRYSDKVYATATEIEDRLSKALEIGCRNKTHVLSWIKLMTEMTLVKTEYGVVRLMCQIVEAVSSVDTSLQHIFVANGLPNIFKSWLRTTSPELMTRDDLNLKQCIIRSLLAMQSCAEAINARAPDLLTMVSELVSMSSPETLSVKDVIEDILCKISNGDESCEPKRFHESLELGFERVRNAAIRLQAVLQQNVNFRIPKKKANGLPERNGQLLIDNGHQESRYDCCRSSSHRENSGQNGCASPTTDRLNNGVGQARRRLRVSRWSNDYRPQKRAQSASRERCGIEVIRCRIDPPVTGLPVPIAGIEHPSTKRCRTVDDEPIIITTVVPNWPQPTVTTNIPPPPPPQLVSPSQMMVPPPPPAIHPAYPTVIPFYEYGPYAAPPVPNYQTYEYSMVNEEFNSSEYRKYYETCEISSLERRLESVMKEMSVLQSILEERAKKKEVGSPFQLSTLQPSTAKTPPPPPPHKEYMWRKAVDEDGAKYYYHKETRESVWELPDGEDSDPGERTPTRMPDTSGCVNEPESDNVENKNSDGSLLSRWSAICSPRVSTSSTLQVVRSTSSVNANQSVNGASQTSEKKRDRDRRIWEKFETDADRKRAKKLMGDIEKVVGPIIMRYIGHRNDATKRRKEWIIKQVSKEMLKRESERADFNFSLTEKGSKRVTDYANAFIQRKCAKEPRELWKGYDGSP